MSRPTKREVDAAKEVVGLAAGEPDIELIDCPSHPGEHQAMLFCYPHRYAGIWECPITGESDSHEHETLDIETTEDWPTGPIDNPREYQIYVCADCGITVDGDPELDAAEAQDDE